jgi:hypothetical protein
MSKQAARKTDAPANTYAAGDLVILTLPDTPELRGTIDTITKTGWIVVALDPASIAFMGDDKRIKDGKISARSRSLAPIKLAPDPEAALILITAEDDPDDEAGEEEKAEHPMAKALREARVRYVKTKRPEGTSSMDCGDMLARTLRDLEPLEVAAMADKVLGEAAGYHAGKYGHLNPGQIRMNSGNRIRAYLKTADAEGMEHAYKVLGWDDEQGDAGEEGEE